MIKFQASIENKWYFLLGLILFFLVAKEAYVLPLTHDEGNTIHCSTTSVKDIVTYADPVPNNHILNTLLIKLNTSLFGERLFIDRLHNFLAFIPLFLFTLAIAKILFDDIWLRLLLLATIVLQPFLLDFFSVTRGYGLSVALQMVSLYYFVRLLYDGKSSDLTKSLVWAALGVYANFTLLNYYIPLSALVIFYSFRQNYKIRKQVFTKELFTIFATGITLLAIIIVPLYKMVSTKQFVYWGNTGFFHDTVKHLTISLRSGVDYFGATHEVIYASFISIIGIVMVIGLIIQWLKKSDTKLYWMMSLLLGVIVYNQLQFYLLDIPFLNARTALFFIPLVSIPFCLSIQNIGFVNKNIGFALVILLNSLILQHFIRGSRVNTNFEWYYDQNTYQVLDHIKSMVESGQAPKPAIINCYWIFYPSLSYHIAHGYEEYIQIAPWDTKISNDNTSVFYYTESGEREQLLEKFDISKDFGYGARFLMRAKGK